MAKVFLSPSTQEYNMYVDGSGSEEFYMNKLADLIEPYLTASGIEFTRNDPDSTVGGSVRKSNAGNYDFHLALHSNAAGTANMGQIRGSDIYYYTWSDEGKRAADLVVNQIKTIYPNPEKVRSLGSTGLYELNNTVAPAILAEIAFHDNPEDAKWIENNLPQIARALSKATADYLGVPFVEPTATPSTPRTPTTPTPQTTPRPPVTPTPPTTPRPPVTPTPPTTGTGTVVTQGGRLNIRDNPSLKGNIIGQIPNGRTITVITKTGDWYRISYNNIEGYVFGQYLKVC